MHTSHLHGYCSLPCPAILSRLGWCLVCLNCLHLSRTTCDSVLSYVLYWTLDFCTVLPVNLCGIFVCHDTVSCSLTFLSSLFFLMCGFLCSKCVVIGRRRESRDSGTPSGCYVQNPHSSNVSLFSISNPQ